MTWRRLLFVLVLCGTGCNESASRPAADCAIDLAAPRERGGSGEKGIAPGGDRGATPDHSPGPVTTVSSLTKDGITWTFDKPVPAGQFVTGDYFVVGPVTVASISPAPTTSSPYLNGSVLDLPAANGKSGFDSRLNVGSDQSSWVDASLWAYPPIAL